MSRICVFCGSKVGGRPIYEEAARRLGRLLVQQGHELVYGAGGIGLMGALADAALGVGGRVRGVIPRSMASSEIAHQGLTQLHVVSNMHERKALMAELSDAFIALPGGYGTFEELMEMITWNQLGIHCKPVAFLNVDGYFDSLVGLIDRAVQEGFIQSKHRSLVLVAEDVEKLLSNLECRQLKTTFQNSSQITGP